MRYFNCYLRASDKRLRPWRFTQHASADGLYTLCGRRVDTSKTWAEGDWHNCTEWVCQRCAKGDGTHKED